MPPSSIAPRKGAADDIQIGIQLPSLGLSGQPLVLQVQNLRRHLCILGQTGGGKSFTAMVLAYEVHLKGIAVLVLDRTGEFAASPLTTTLGVTVHEPGVNFTLPPFARVSADLEDDVERAVSLFEHYVRITRDAPVSPLQTRVLREALAACHRRGSSRLAEVVAELRTKQERRRDLKGWVEAIEAVISRLGPLMSGSMARVFDPPLGKAQEDQSNADLFFHPGLHIVNLGLFDTDDPKDLVSQIVCKMMTDHGRRLGRTDSLRLVLVVDEAHHLAPNDREYYGVLERYAIELRKYGMGLVVIATRPTQISENVLANCSTVISHQLTSSKDIDLALNFMVNRLEADRFMADLRLLEVGECMVQLNDTGSPTPFRCKIGLPEHEFLIGPVLHPGAGVAVVAKEDGLPAISKSSSASRDVPPPDDSAWTAYEHLPSWARDAITLVYSRGGMAPAKILRESGCSNRQLKEMVFGRYPVTELAGPASYRLTKLGMKVASIELTRGSRGEVQPRSDRSV